MLAYARQTRLLVGFKCPVRDRTLEEITIPNAHYESASTHGGVGRCPATGMLARFSAFSLETRFTPAFHAKQPAGSPIAYLTDLGTFELS